MKLLFHIGTSKIKNRIMKHSNAIEFLRLTIKKGDISLLADLKIITAILQQNAADRAQIAPKYG